MRHIDLFSGIGGFALAASWVWGDEYENVGHCEIEEYACKVYHKHFPNSPHLGDITKVKWHEGQADIITGGFPCQPHSMAGKRKASEDERDLWYQCKRAIGEIRPRYAFFENVSGLLTSESGRFFNRVLSDLAQIGYDVEWCIIPANSIGAIHERERIWIVANNSKNGRNGSIIEGAITKIRKMGNKQWIDSEVNWSGVRFKGKRWNTKRENVCQSTICRMDDGVPYWMDRLAGLGNAIVPQVAEVILRAIKESDNK